MTNALNSVLKGVGLFDIKRRVGLELRGRGWLPWRPLVPIDEFAASARAIIAHLDARPGFVWGDYLEFGVSRGTSLAIMANALTAADHVAVRSVGFDSFEGMPTDASAEGWSPGEFKSTLDATTAHLIASGAAVERIELVKGWFADTLTAATKERLALTRASVAMFDCDIYSATRDALWFVAPLVTDRAVFIFDDWGWRSDIDEIGQKEAFAEFLAAFPHFAATPLPAYCEAARVFEIEAVAA